jgi:hypothetical protein
MLAQERIVEGPAFLKRRTVALELLRCDRPLANEMVENLRHDRSNAGPFNRLRAMPHTQKF